MKTKRLLWQLYPSYLLIMLISLAAIGLYASSSTQQFYYDQVSDDLKASAHMIEKQVLDKYISSDAEELNDLCNSLVESVQRRITVIDMAGRVIAETQKDPQKLKDHSNRPEIIAAISEGHGTDIRPSESLGKDLMYIAIPLKTQAETVGVLRIAKPVSAINRQLNSIYNKILIGSLIIAVVAALLSLIISRKVSSPLVELKKGADQFAQGNLTHKLPVGNCQEIDTVANAMNQMAGEIDQRIRTIMRQRNEHKAVLSSMSEAVLAVDSGQKLITLNESASEMIGFDISNAKGRPLQEVIRNSSLQNFITKSLQSNDPAEDRLTVYKDGNEFLLHAKSNTLQDENGRKIGILVVMNDITRIKKLEKVRSDFVANVSHELKTPITSIKGFVETLQEGAIEKPEEAKRFLDIIANQSNRLDAIIDDLLELSKIEQQGKDQIKMTRGPVKEAILSAVELCESKANDKQIDIKLSCDDDVTANVNMHLLEQSISNLLDNAIKYSPAGSSIEVYAETAAEQVNISVKDFGCGIDKKSLPRLFERFFRVDKARSRKLGGTGLGLAIVKHIAEAHNGSVSVESTLGKGSKFTISLPA